MIFLHFCHCYFLLFIHCFMLTLNQETIFDRFSVLTQHLQDVPVRRCYKRHESLCTNSL